MAEGGTNEFISATGSLGTASPACGEISGSIWNRHSNIVSHSEPCSTLVAGGAVAGGFDSAT